MTTVARLLAISMATASIMLLAAATALADVPSSPSSEVVWPVVLGVVVAVIVVGALAWLVVRRVRGRGRGTEQGGGGDVR